MADNTAKRYLDLEGLRTFYDLLVKKFADKSELVTLKDSLKNYITTILKYNKENEIKKTFANRVFMYSDKKYSSSFVS